MARRMLIDASHTEETRVAVVNGKRLEDFDYETARKKQLKGNVYLAKVVRVEPSLQAAFVDYGGNRHGFLAFSEIHPDYYQIPVADREQLLAEENRVDESEESENGSPVETVGGDETDEIERRRLKHYRNYKIQEVIKRRQIMLVQVVKEERGNKGAALTTYLSLAGRYCVLMPNTARGGGISRKIGSQNDRRRLKKILDDLSIPEGMAVIVRTAGAERTKAEIKRDYDYLVRLWDEIRSKTMESIAPTLVHEEANLIKRSIRDLYSKDIDEVLVEGEESYRVAKDFMKAMVPSHAKRVQRYDDTSIPLFFRYQVENQIDAIHTPVVQLRSGGYLVIHSTEALVAIDVNSGRATRERHIEETALKTNLEAADEIARQLRLRDLAGLIVIDFIDMEVQRNNTAVERRFKEALRNERARIQLGHISPFGLLEMSRQRLRPSLLETSSEICPACGGAGHIRSTESTVLRVMRGIEEEGLRRRSLEIAVFVPTKVALYILNHKRSVLAAIEQRYSLQVNIFADDSLIPPEFRVERVVAREGAEEAEAAEEGEATGEEAAEGGGRRRRRSRRRGRDRREDDTAEAKRAESADAEPADVEAEEAETGKAEAVGESPRDGDAEEPRKRRRRGRRGGRRRGRKGADSAGGEAVSTASDAQPDGDVQTADSAAELPASVTGVVEAASEDAEAAKPRRRRSTRRRGKTAEAESEATPPTPVEAEAPAAAAVTDDKAEVAAKPKKPARRSRKRTADKDKSKPQPANDTAEPAKSASNGSGPAEPEQQKAAPSSPVPPAEEPVPAASGSAMPASEGEAVPDTAPLPEKPRRVGWWRRSLGK